MTYLLERVLGSKTRAVLLAKIMMNSERKFYIRELERETKIPYGMLYKEEKNLVSLGILKEEKKGKITFVSANKDSPNFSELKGLVIKTAGLADILKKTFMKIEKINYALIFGSFASGTETENSDVDLLVVGEAKEDYVLKSSEETERKIGREVNYILWKEKEFLRRAKESHHLLKEILKNPVIMIIGDENGFRKVAGRSENKKDRAKQKARR